jgi:nucleotide-binding universal stress UspA family protein
VKGIDQRFVEGDPATALLDAVVDANRDLIIVGNRGLGAAPGQLLGSVPGEVARRATCDVLIVQTTPGQMRVEDLTA